MELVQLYKSILKSIFVEADESGALSLVFGKGGPLTIGEKRMVIPERDVLINSDFTNLIAFHPLSEDVMKGESAVIQKLRKLILFRLTTSLQLLATELLSLAGNSENHAQLSPTLQKRLLKPMSKADASSITQLSNLFKKLSLNGQQRLLSVYLRRGGKICGTGFARAAIIAFPMLTELENDDRKVYGETVKVDNVKVLKALFNIIVPGYETTETYSFGSNSKVAPFFHALMGAYAKLAIQINLVADEFKDQLTSYDTIHIDTDWVEHVTDISIYNNKLEPMEGNMGSIVEDKTTSYMDSVSIDTSGVLNAPVPKPEASVQLPQTPQLQPAQYIQPAPAPQVAIGDAPPAPVEFKPIGANVSTARAATAGVSVASDNQPGKLDWSKINNNYQLQAQQEQQRQQQMLQMQQAQAMQMQHMQQQQLMYPGMVPAGYPQPMQTVAYGMQPQANVGFPPGMAPGYPQMQVPNMGGPVNHIRGNPGNQFPQSYGQPGYAQPTMPYGNVQPGMMVPMQTIYRP